MKEVSFRLMIFASLLSIGVSLKILHTDDKSCVVTTDQGKVDLKPISSSDTSSPRFSISSGNIGGEEYFWNPCTDFNTPLCGKMELCAVAAGTIQGIELGSKESSSFDVQGSSLVIKYDEGGSVILECSNGADKFTQAAVQEQFKLASKHACPQNVPSPTKAPASGLSIGSILLIIVLVLVVLYVVVGILIMKFVRKAEGAEVIPNASFWKEIPGLVKDGTMFVVRRGKTGSKYDSL